VCIHGFKSSWKMVTSGVPQGSVLGPVLFLIFINDLDSHLVTSLLKFADDSKLFGKVNNDSDRDVIQQDLHSLVEWSDKWQMTFNTEKCKVMHLGKQNKRFDYYMNNQKLGVVNEEKDLGVLITDDLKPSSQCRQAYGKASRVLGMISRTISYKTPTVLLKLYKTLVRPHLEYCIPVWSPYYSRDKVLLERVQHRFTRMLPGPKQKSYFERLEVGTLGVMDSRGKKKSCRFTRSLSNVPGLICYTV